MRLLGQKALRRETAWDEPARTESPMKGDSLENDCLECNCGKDQQLDGIARSEPLAGKATRRNNRRM